MYCEEIESVLAGIRTKPIIVFATSRNNKVTARNMSVVTIDDKIYFQTGLSMEKAQQLIANDNVAFCVDNYQIYGKAKNIGAWDQHESVLEEYRRNHDASYEKYKKVSDEIIVETAIEEIEMWEYRNGLPYIIRYDLPGNIFTEKEYIIE
jgi:general stress protein 26